MSPSSSERKPHTRAKSGVSDGMGDGDWIHLERARRLARRGWGRVHPNPLVGCVVVKEGSVVAEAFHAEFGGLHAERAALEAAGDAAEGSTVYVSLEPCNHRGKTPPCTEALISAGVARVVYGAREPGTMEGGGGDALRAAGIDVVGPVLSDAEARRDNPAFFRRTEGGPPHVEVKLAMSVDGRIAARPDRQTWLTGPEARGRVHRLRAGFSAILIGSGTALADDPRLTVRDGPLPRVHPSRLVVDGRCRLSPDAALFEDVERVPVVVFTREDAPEERKAALEKAGAEVVAVAGSENGVDLSAALRWCEERRYHSILCEGGGRLATSLLRRGHCGRLHLFITPRILGHGAVPAFRSEVGEDLLEGWRVVGDADTVGEDIVIALEPGTDGKVV